VQHYSYNYPIAYLDITINHPSNYNNLKMITTIHINYQIFIKVNFYRLIYQYWRIFVADLKFKTMKKLIITTAILAILGVSAFAYDGGKKPITGDVNVTYAALNHFKTDFKKVKNAAWTVTSNCQKVTFDMDGVTMTAFYSLTGDYLGVTHNVDYDKVPAGAQKEINSNYDDYTSKGVIKFEYTGDNKAIDPLVYFVDLKKADSEIVLKVTADEKVSFFKKVK
jgi:hypothetical protein